MILPTKHLPPERALLTVGAQVLQQLQKPLTVSSLWAACQSANQTAANQTGISHLNYNTYILALDFLFMLGIIVLKDGLLVRTDYD